MNINGLSERYNISRKLISGIVIKFLNKEESLLTCYNNPEWAIRQFL